MEATNDSPFYQRFYQYQKERFPFIGHGILIATFTFSAISFSRICRGAEGFISLKAYLISIFTTITLFFLVRIFDEFKDAEDDALYRKHLPVPRGLISFKELKILGIITCIAQILVNSFFNPKMFLLYIIFMVYLMLMGKEFFVASWLKKHPLTYVASHMVIIPLVDVYASGMDWLLAGVKAPTGLLFFFAVSYMNGVVLEFGRKIKVPENEEVNTYSTLYGADKATYAYIGILFTTLLLSIAAAWVAGYGLTGVLALSACFIVCSFPAWIFLKKKTVLTSKLIEYSSALWTALMYFTLGGIPMLTKLIHG